LARKGIRCPVRAMKTRTLLLSLLLTGTAFALLPSAQAAEIPGPVVCVTDPCPPYPVPTVNYCTLKQATPDQVPFLGAAINPRQTVWGSDAGCDIDVVGPDMTCAPPSSTGIDQTVGPVHLRAGVCDGGIPDRIAPITTTAAPPIYCVMTPCGPCICPPPVVDISWCKAESTTPEPLRALVWGTDSGCDIDVETNWYCLYGEVPVDRSVGPVHVVTRICTPDLPDIVSQ
jgi:hypothetical protein